MSQTGVQQGDPLGPFLFALTWQRLAKKLPPDLLFNLWFLDDGHLVGSWDQLKKAWDILKGGADDLGISLNLKKCKLWGPANQVDAMDIDNSSSSSNDLCNVPRVPWAAGHGLKVLGLPVEHPSSSSFRASCLREIVDTRKEMYFELSNLGDPHGQLVAILCRCM